jgi:hypothetical protein
MRRWLNAASRENKSKAKGENFSDHHPEIFLNEGEKPQDRRLDW